MSSEDRVQNAEHGRAPALTAPSAPRATKAVSALAILAGIGLVAFVGVRVKETMASRKALEAGLAAAPTSTAADAKVSTTSPAPLRYSPVLPVTGTLAPVQDADVGFKMGGRLSVVRVKVGDVVKLGQPLAALDVSEASAQTNAANAGVKAAEVSLAMAEDAYKRTEALYASGSISEAERVATANRRNLALAQLEQAKAQQHLASVGVGNGSLAAPFAGLVTKAPTGIGKIVGPGEPLFHVEDTSTLKLTASIAESDAKLVAVGDEVMIDEASADASAPAQKNGARGRVTAVLGSLDPATRRVPVIAELPNAGGATHLYAGAFVRASVLPKREIDVLKLPATALRPGSQDEVVVVKNGAAHLAKILFATANDGSLLVRSGVSREDAVVLGPSSETREGDPLTVSK